MAAVANTYRVIFHFQDGNGRKVTEDYVEFLQAPDSSYNSLRTVLVTSNARQKGPGTLVITSCQNMLPAGVIA